VGHEHGTQARRDAVVHARVTLMRRASNNLRLVCHRAAEKVLGKLFFFFFFFFFIWDGPE
jgi:hypothetical protein